MSMNNVQKNIAVTIRQKALAILEIKNSLSVLTQMYATENMAALLDSDYAELPEFVNVQVAEMTAAKNALDAINTAIGDYSAGTNATKLTKIMNVVPQ